VDFSGEIYFVVVIVVVVSSCIWISFHLFDHVKLYAIYYELLTASLNKQRIGKYKSYHISAHQIVISPSWLSQISYFYGVMINEVTQRSYSYSCSRLYKQFTQ